MSSELRPFFYGSYVNRLNSKGQVAIPKRFRSTVGDSCSEGFVLLQGEGGCVYMYTHSQFAEVRDRVRQIAVEDGDAEFFRTFMESAFAVDLDSQGRFVFPSVLREAAGVKGPDVLFVGVDDRIEIWEPKKRSAHGGESKGYQERRRENASRIFGF